MGKNIGLERYLKSLKPTSRKKTVKDQGEGVKRGEAHSEGMRAAYGETGAAAKQIASGRATREYMARKMRQQREIKADPAKRAEQEKLNAEAERKVKHELITSRLNREGVDEGTVFDYSSDYVPLDDRLGRDNNRRRIRNAYRKVNRK